MIDFGPSISTGMYSAYFEVFLSLLFPLSNSLGSDSRDYVFVALSAAGLPLI
jgi:hypothetical protein